VTQVPQHSERYLVLLKLLSHSIWEGLILKIFLSRGQAPKNSEKSVQNLLKSLSQGVQFSKFSWGQASRPPSKYLYTRAPYSKFAPGPTNSLGGPGHSYYTVCISMHDSPAMYTFGAHNFCLIYHYLLVTYHRELLPVFFIYVYNF